MAKSGFFSKLNFTHLKVPVSRFIFYSHNNKSVKATYKRLVTKLKSQI